jgi:hypothetical protein
VYPPLKGQHALANDVMTNRDLVDLERTIGNGFAKFLEVGNALMEIQTRRLYLDDGYNTFEQYCAKRWSISRSQAYRMIQAAEVVGHISAHEDVPLPIHETQTRVLARLKDPETIRTAWEEVVDEYGDAASAPKVRDSVDYYAAIEEKPQRAAWPREEVIAAYREEQKRGAASPATAPVDDDEEPPTRFIPPTRETEQEEAPATLSVRDVQNRLSAARQLLALEPSEWALRLDDVIAAEVRTMAHDLRVWCDAMEVALRRG